MEVQVGRVGLHRGKLSLSGTAARTPSGTNQSRRRSQPGGSGRSGQHVDHQRRLHACLDQRLEVGLPADRPLPNHEALPSLPLRAVRPGRRRTARRRPMPSTPRARRRGARRSAERLPAASRPRRPGSADRPQQRCERGAGRDGRAGFVRTASTSPSAPARSPAWRSASAVCELSNGSVAAIAPIRTSRHPNRSPKAATSSSRATSLSQTTREVASASNSPGSRATTGRSASSRRRELEAAATGENKEEVAAEILEIEQAIATDRIAVAKGISDARIEAAAAAAKAAEESAERAADADAAAAKAAEEAAKRAADTAIAAAEKRADGVEAARKKEAEEAQEAFADTERQVESAEAERQRRAEEAFGDRQRQLEQAFNDEQRDQEGAFTRSQEENEGRV